MIKRDYIIEKIKNYLWDYIAHISRWDYEITFIVICEYGRETVIFGEFEGDCYKQKFRLN